MRNVEIIKFAILYVDPANPSVSSIGTSASTSMISTTLSEKKSNHPTSTGFSEEMRKCDLQKTIQILQREVKLEATTMSVTESLNKALKSMGEQLSKLIDNSRITPNEIAYNTYLGKDSHRTLDDLDRKSTW